VQIPGSRGSTYNRFILADEGGKETYKELTRRKQNLPEEYT
jgi:hypothetical protein